MRKTTLKVALLAAVMVTSGAAMADEAAFKKLHAEAVAALDKAKKVDGEWRDSRWKKSKAVKCGDKKMSHLHAAECYAKAGDYKKAMKHAGIAKKQGELGYQQSMDQKNAGPRF